ncbi:hypothetical protein KR009_009760, partial [Drosophila setifemur]
CSSGAPYLPHPSDCHKFIQCSNGNEYIFDCPAGLYWDYQKYVCSGDERLCYDGGNSNPEENVCQNGVDFAPDPSDCTKYIQCANGQPIERKCPDPLYWNQDIKSCDWSNKFCR